MTSCDATRPPLHVSCTALQECAHDFDLGRGRGGERIRRRVSSSGAAGPPGRRSGRSPPRPVPGSTVGEHQPHLSPLADRVLDRPTPITSPVTTSSSSRCRTARRRRSPPRSADDALVVDCGADFRLAERRAWDDASTAATHAGTWPYGLPELPGQRERARRRRRRIAVPGCYPTVVDPRAHARGRGRPGRADRRHRRRRRPARRAPARALKPHLLGAEVMGSGQRVRGRRRAPAHPRDRAEPRAPAERAITGVVHARPRADGPRHPRDVHGPARRRRRRRRRPRRVREGVRRRAVRPPAARRTVAADAGRPRRERWSTSRRRSTSAPDGSSPSARSTTSPRAPPAARCSR